MDARDCVIHIVDDEEAVRKSLAFMLTAAGFTVRAHASATSFLAAAWTKGSACLVTDLRMPDMSGVELLERLHNEGRMMPAVVITGHGDVPMAVAAMKAGAIDFIEKPFEEDVLIDAIKKAGSQLRIPEATVENRAMLRDRLEQLSDRERQILTLVVSGLPNKTIGYDLSISPRTVEVHRANIMSKMQARNLPELVRMTLALDFDG